MKYVRNQKHPSVLRMKTDYRQSLQNGKPSRGSIDYMNRILHDVPSNINADGLDVGRLKKLADFIRTLRLLLKPKFPFIEYEYANKYHEVTHYLIATHKHGIGVFRFLEGGKQGEFEFRGLTGFGLICWGWGSNGMANVCTNRHANHIQRVLTAAPILGLGEERITGEFIDLDTNLIAEALLEYIEYQDAETAWRIVVDRYHAGQITPFEPDTENSEDAEHQPENPVIDQTSGEYIRQGLYDETQPREPEGFEPIPKRRLVTVETRRPKPRVSANEKVETILNWIESADSIEDVQTYVKLLRKELEKG